MSASPTVYVQGVQCSFAMPGGRVTFSQSFAAGGPSIEVIYRCLWADRINLVSGLLGTCVGTARNFHRTAPHAFPDNPRLTCTAVGDFGYVGSAVDGSGYVSSILVDVPARYEYVPWQFVDGDPAGQNDLSGQAWTVTKVKPSSEVYQPSGGTLWVGPFPSTTPLDEGSVGLIRSYTQIQVTRKFLPAIDTATYKPALGHVSSNSTRFGTDYYQPGSLLLLDVESEPYADCLGNPVCDITEHYLGRSGISWNSVQDRNLSWQRVDSSKLGTGMGPFDPPYDFSTFPR